MLNEKWLLTAVFLIMGEGAFADGLTGAQLNTVLAAGMTAPVAAISSLTNKPNGIAGLDASGVVTVPVSGDVSGATVASGRTLGKLSGLVDTNTAAISTVQTTANAAIPSARIGVANGVAGLNASGQLIAASVGDVSGAQVTSGSVARSLKSRFNDAINPIDYGAKGDGTTNDIAAFQATQSAAQGLGGATITLPSGHKWALGSLVYGSNTVFWDAGAHTSIVDTSGNIAGNVQGLVDSSIVHNGHTTWGQDSGTYNMSALQLSMLWQDDSQTTAGWQKNAFYTRDDCGAASAYKTGTVSDSVLAAKDCVGIESQVRTSGSVKTARLYAQHNDVYIFSGSDAWAIAYEPEIYNYGSDQPQTGKATTKMVMHPGCYGTYACTASIEIAGLQHVGLLSSQDQFPSGGWMWAMWPHLSSDVTAAPVAGLKQDGTLLTTGITSSGAVTATTVVADLSSATATPTGGASTTLAAALAALAPKASPAFTGATAFANGALVDANGIGYFSSTASKFLRAYSCPTFGTDITKSSALLSWNCSGSAGEADIIVSGDTGTSKGLVVYQMDSTNTTKTKLWAITGTGIEQRVTMAVASLPTCSAGQTVFVSDARNTGEAAGAGTGALAYCTTAGKWFANGAAVAN